MAVAIHQMVVYGNRAVNAWGLIQAGLRAQNALLSWPPIGWSTSRSTPHGGL